MRWRLLVVLMAMVAALAGCADPAPPAKALPTGSLAIQEDTAVWVDGRTAHVGDTAFDLEPRPETVVAGVSGLYFLSKGVLYVADEAGSREVGVLGDSSPLVASADRRYLGYVDFGPQYGARPADTVVYDTMTGAQVVRTRVGNGEGPDLLDLYAESPPGLIGFDDDAAYVMAASSNDIYRLPLDGGEPQNLGDEGPAGIRIGGNDERVWVGHADDLWRIMDTSWRLASGYGGATRYPGGPYGAVDDFGPTVFFEVETGGEVDLRSDFKHLRLGTWTGPAEFLGVGFDGRFAGAPVGRSAVVRCSLTSRTCVTLGTVAGYAERDGILFATGRETGFE